MSLQDIREAEVAALKAEIERLRAVLLEAERLKIEYIEGHNKLAERAGVLEVALRNFADPSNWYEKVGCQQWMGKRDAVDLAQSVLSKTAQVKK